MMAIYTLGSYVKTTVHSTLRSNHNLSGWCQYSKYEGAEVESNPVRAFMVLAV